MGRKGTVLGGGGYQSGGAQHYVLAVIDLDAPHPAPVPIPMGFLAHGAAFDPLDVNRVAVFEKKGPGACLFDLRERTVTGVITTRPNRSFYGHGAFSADGSLLYATESCLDRNFAGVLVVRDAKTFAELGTLPTHAASPHDCRLIDDGKTMVVANGGGAIHEKAVPACVTYIEIASGKLLERVLLGSPRVNAGHVDITSAGDLAVVSAPRDGIPSPNTQLGAVSLRPKGKSLRTLKEPQTVVSRMLGETLSVVINERDRVALTTHPLGDCVSVWGLDDSRSLGTIELRGPRGVAMTLDREWYLVSHFADKNVRLTALSAADRAPTGFYVDPSFISGSHIFVHDLARAA